MKAEKTIRQVVFILQETLSEIEELESSDDAQALIQAKINVLNYVLGEE